MCDRVQNLLSGKKRTNVLKVVLIGDSGVGKSVVANAYVNGVFDMSLPPTVVCDCRMKNVILDDEPYQIVMWDTAGPLRSRSLRSKFYEGADCCVVVFALNNRHSYRGVPDWHHQFMSYLDASERATFPFVVIGNKLDSEYRVPIIRREDIMSECVYGDGIKYFETSATVMDGVNTAFDEVVRRAKLYQDAKKLAALPDYVRLGEDRGSAQAYIDICSCVVL